MRIVVALGGNALLRRGERMTARPSARTSPAAAASIAELAADHEVVVTHGNGPQVGLLALQQPDDPLDILDAETEGQIGYLLEQELATRCRNAPIATLLTQVVVDPLDPAFEKPTKPIGPVYRVSRRSGSPRRAAGRSQPDGASFRRVVASPEPLAIVEIDAIQLAVDSGVLVICVGGGGIPVVADEYGALHGVEAVIDKDLAAALLAVMVDADVLLMLTDVDHVMRDWATPAARPLSEVLAPVHAPGARDRPLPDSIVPIPASTSQVSPGQVRAACRYRAR